MSMQTLKTEGATEKLDCGICGAHLELISHHSFWSTSEQDLFAFCDPCMTEIKAAVYHPATIIIEAKNV